MALTFLRQAAAALLFGSTAGCSALVALLAGPSTPPPADFVVITRHFAGATSLAALTQRAEPGLRKQGAALQSADALRVKYDLQLSDRVASLVLRQNAGDVTLKVVARGPYAGELALRVSACTKVLRQAAGAAPAAAAAEPASAESAAGAAAPANPGGAATGTGAGPTPTNPPNNPTEPSAPHNVNH